MTALDRLAPYRSVLYVLAAIGFVGLNGAFLAYALFQPELMAEAFANPIALVFILEAFLMMGVLAWLISRVGFQNPGWGLFVVLSIIGSLAFSVPAFLLLHLRNERESTRAPAPRTT
jgi:hypothetical protein